MKISSLRVHDQKISENFLITAPSNKSYIQLWSRLIQPNTMIATLF